MFHWRDLTPILALVIFALQGNVDWTFSVYALRSPARAILSSTIPARRAEFQANLLPVTVSNSNTSPGSEMRTAVLHWVVQRGAQTDVLITFRSFRDRADAEVHKAELERVSDDKRSKVTIETLPFPHSPS